MSKKSKPPTDEQIIRNLDWNASLGLCNDANDARLFRWIEKNHATISYPSGSAGGCSFAALDCGTIAKDLRTAVTSLMGKEAILIKLQAERHYPKPKKKKK